MKAFGFDWDYWSPNFHFGLFCWPDHHLITHKLLQNSPVFFNNPLHLRYHLGADVSAGDMPTNVWHSVSVVSVCIRHLHSKVRLQQCYYNYDSGEHINNTMMYDMYVEEEEFSITFIFIITYFLSLWWIVKWESSQW